MTTPMPPWLRHLPRFTQPALCAETAPDVWFPEKDDGSRSTHAAKRVCNGTGDTRPCPAREECLAWALAHGERHGVWGGLAPKERARLKRRQVAA